MTTLPHAPSCSRRQLLRTVATAASVCALPTWSVAATSSRGPVVAQVVDTSPQQQDVAQDFLIGARAAWQDINTHGGLRGTPVHHLVIEVDGSTASLRNAIGKINDTPGCVVMSGSVGGSVATQLMQLLHSEKLAIAHAAPWLPTLPSEKEERTFAIFASHQAQITQVLKNQASLGIKQLGVIYASARDEALHQEDVQLSAAQMQISLQTFRASDDLRALGQRLGPNTPAMLLFVGGTPELARFTQGLDKQARQRYVIGLADINLQTLTQMGGKFQTPIIAAQAVPQVTSGLQVVRQYRQVMAQLFDEAPSPLSLSGFIAARYTYEVLNDITGPLTRAQVLETFQRRATVDLGGFQVSPSHSKNNVRFVTQSMLTNDGRVIG